MLSVLGEVQHEELLPTGQMPRRLEIVRTETNLDLPPHPRLLRSHARPSTDTGRTCRPTRGRPFRDDMMQGLAWRRSPRRNPAPATRANAQQIGNRQSGARPSTDTRRTRRPTRGRPYNDDLGLTTLEGTLMGCEWKILV